jgi:hypothetical protein
MLDCAPYSRGSKTNVSIPAKRRHIAPIKILFLKSLSNHIHLISFVFLLPLIAGGIFSFAESVYCRTAYPDAAHRRPETE